MNLQNTCRRQAFIEFALIKNEKQLNVDID